MYPQMPYEEIDEATYVKTIEKIRPLDFKKVRAEDVAAEKFCDNSSCEV